MAEATRTNADAARIIFYVVAVLMAIYGVGLLLFPQLMFNISDDPGVPANPGWVRWGGGLLLGTATAAWLAANQSANQKPLAVGLATGFSFIALALLYGTLVGNYRGEAWVGWLQIVGSAVLAAALWWLSAQPSLSTSKPQASAKTAKTNT